MKAIDIVGLFLGLELQVVVAVKFYKSGVQRDAENKSTYPAREVVIIAGLNKAYEYTHRPELHDNRRGHPQESRTRHELTTSVHACCFCVRPSDEDRLPTGCRVLESQRASSGTLSNGESSSDADHQAVERRGRARQQRECDPLASLRRVKMKTGRVIRSKNAVGDQFSRVVAPVDDRRNLTRPTRQPCERASNPPRRHYKVLGDI
ncbi:hypothetical protein R3P38DRAFT_2806556 [Favolaschia claudopus]|uniref:Uncharacterized protein n=1 Tax=Favolaschia claudopus TaxID=2862362 RepID=A0AAV9ZJI7_9AGAR